jgi:hypothetical protein
MSISTGQRPVTLSAITAEALKGRKPGIIAASVLNTINKISGFTGFCRCYCNPAILLILLIVFKTWRNNPLNPLKGTSVRVTAHPDGDGMLAERVYNPYLRTVRYATNFELNIFLR